MPSHPLSDAPRILAPIALHYTAALQAYGPEPRGVFWRDEEGQRLRFEKLVGIVDDEDGQGGIAITDLGCGYGAMFDFLKELPIMNGSRYYGYDICEEMVETARRRIRDRRATFEQSLRPTRPADYAFVSGTYNLKLDTDDRVWLDYVRKSLVDLWGMTAKGLAFNMLAIDRSKARQKTLYYANPVPFFDFCLRNLSDQVTLVQDYPLAEWTMWVRR